LEAQECSWVCYCNVAIARHANGRHSQASWYALNQATNHPTAAIYFKNLISKRWNPKDEHAISPEDRAVVRQNLIQVMVHSTRKIRVQVTSCLGAILREDFPQDWPEFLPGVLEMLKSTDIAVVHAGLLAYLELVKIFQWKRDGKREPLNEALQTGLPLLLRIADGLLASDNEEAGDMLRLVLKIYFRSIQISLSKCQRESASTEAWIGLFLRTIDKEIPLESLPEDEAERERHPWWKAKKWAYANLNKLFCKYGDPHADDSKKNIQWAKAFESSIAPEILNAYLKQMEAMIGGKWMSPRCQHSIATFLNEAVQHKKTWLALKPHIESIVGYFIFPLQCFKEKDQELWDEDPVEYIRKKNDPLEDFKSPVFASSSLLLTLARSRRSMTFMPIITYINSVLTSAKDPRQIDGALAMAGSMAEEMIDEGSPIRDDVESFLVYHVIPLLESPHAFLRERACELLNRFEEMEWKSRDNTLLAFQGISKCLRDKELPVRVSAALGMSSLLREESSTSYFSTLHD
jgi:hypothetical protein